LPIGIALVLCIACAGLFRFSNPETQTQVDQFADWAEAWIVSVQRQAPVLLAAAALVPGSQPYVVAATLAIDSCASAVHAYVQLTQGKATAECIHEAQETVVTSINTINTNVEEIRRILRTQFLTE